VAIASSMPAPQIDWHGGGAGRDPLARAVVVRLRLAVAALVVADGHPFAAFAADHEPLQQCGSFAGRAGAALLIAVGGGVGGERLLVVFVLLEGDVSGVRILDQDGPLVARFDHGAGVTVDVGELLASSVEVRACISGVVEGEQHEVVAQRLPVELAGVRAAGRVPGGDAQLLGGELLDDRVRRAGPLKAAEQVRDRGAHARVRVKRDVPQLVIGQADRQPDAQLAAGGLREQPALQAGADEVKLRLGDRAL
jgi:hypothetical protein